MNITSTTYLVVSMTPRGSFSYKYEGTSEDEALKAYNKLTDRNAPRMLSRKEAGNQLSQTVMCGGGFPED